MGCLQSKPSAADQAQGCSKGAAAGGGAAAAPVLVVGKQAGPQVQQQGGSDLSNGKGGGQVTEQQQQQQRYNPAEGGPCCPLLVLYKDDGASSASGGTPLPADEQDRFTQLCSYNILDTEPEEAYDRITALCKSLFNVPIAMVTFVDKDRVWLKSVQGLPGLTQVERRQSICAWTLMSRYPEALVVPNLTQDVRFSDSPVVVGWPHARFYAACPLVNGSGMRLGTLCILDTKPREFSVDNTVLLTQLASMVMREVERKRAMNDALCSAALRQTSGDSITHDTQAIMLCDMAPAKWPIHLVNDAWQRVTGITQELAVGSHFWDLFEPPLPAQVQAYRLAIEQHRNFELRVPVNVNTAQFITQPDSGAAAAAAPGSGGSSGGWQPPPPPDPSRRRSLGGGMRYIRFQFRSVSSVASHMVPAAVSVPPVLMSSADGAGSCYYWATVDLPGPGSLREEQGFADGSMLAQRSGSGLGGSTGSSAVAVRRSHGHAAPGGPSDVTSPRSSHCASSGHSTMPSSDSSTSGAGPLRTTFSLLPEENPFQEITLGSLLGWGSYGRVHRGYWNGSLVAVKVLEQVAGDFNPRSSLEPLLHHRLSHPNVVAMFDVCTQELDVCEDGRALQEVWMVLEFCNRGTLSDAIARGWLLSVVDGAPQAGCVNLPKALATAREVAGALEYLHSQNVLHGDLNGNNILLAGAAVAPGSPDQRGFIAKVADFGLSRLLSPENEQIITRTHGTITHMAPEVITEATHSKSSDVYSFGVLLFELLSGAKPYAGMHYAQIVACITTGKLLQQLPSAARSLPAGLTQLLGDCLAAAPGARPTFAEVHARLAAAEQQLQQQPAAAAAATAAQGGAWRQQQALQAQRQQLAAQGMSPAAAASIAAAAAAAAAAESAATAAVAAATAMASDATVVDGEAGQHTLADVLAAAAQQQPVIPGNGGSFASMSSGL